MNALPAIGPELRRQHEVSAAAHARLWGRPGARPGANMPRTSTAAFRKTTRPAVDIEYASKLVCEDQQVTVDQLFNSNSAPPLPRATCFGRSCSMAATRWRTSPASSEWITTRSRSGFGRFAIFSGGRCDEQSMAQILSI